MMNIYDEYMQLVQYPHWYDGARSLDDIDLEDLHKLKSIIEIEIESRDEVRMNNEG